MSLHGGGNGAALVLPSGFTRVNGVFRADVTYTPGAISALVATVTTTTLTGLLTTDGVAVSCTSGLPLGAAIASVRCSATNTLEIVFTTAVAIGVTLGSLTFRVMVFR